MLGDGNCAALSLQIEANDCMGEARPNLVRARFLSLSLRERDQVDTSENFHTKND